MKYIDADLLKAEIEQLRDEYTDIAIDSHYGTVNANHVVVDLEQLLSFLDFLPEQPMIKKSNALFDKCVENCDPAVMKEVSDKVDKMLGRQPVEGLEEEIDNYIENERYFPDDERPIVMEIARHFAEWGREQVLQEIYDGKVKPVDKITAAWLDDESKAKEDK